MKLAPRRSLPWLAGGVLALTVLLGRNPTTVSAANTPLGFVDVERVISEYKQVPEYTKSLDKFRAELQKPLTELEMGMLLDEGERNDLKTLLSKATLTPAEQTKLDALKKKNEDNGKELRQLEAAASLNPEQAKRKTELINRVRDQNDKAAKLNEGLSKQFQDKQQEMDSRVRNDIQAAIDAVAEQQAVEVVLDKKAVLHGGKDKEITDQVISRLNGPAK